MNDRVQNMVIAGLDQDYAGAVDLYDGWTPAERGELMNAIIGGQRGETIPEQWLVVICGLASVAILEVALRWKARDAETPGDGP